MATTADSESGEVRELRAHVAELAAAADDRLRRVLERSLGRHWLPKSIRTRILPETANL